MGDFTKFTCYGLLTIKGDNPTLDLPDYVVFIPITHIFNGKKLLSALVFLQLTPKGINTVVRTQGSPY